MLTLGINYSQMHDSPACITRYSTSALFDSSDAELMSQQSSEESAR
jgi:hypothetical protein